MWEEIRNLKIGGVTWELAPEFPPKSKGIEEYEKVDHINFIPDEIPVPANTPPVDPIKIVPQKQVSINSRPLIEKKKRK